MPDARSRSERRRSEGKLLMVCSEANTPCGEGKTGRQGVVVELESCGAAVSCGSLPGVGAVECAVQRA